MRSQRKPRGLPLRPLQHAYRARGVPSLAALQTLPGLGRRCAAILGATTRFLYPEFLERASEEAFREQIVRFYEAVVPRAVHVETVRRRAGFLRHGLTHLLHGRNAEPERLAACLDVRGPYRVAGLGPSFWSALLQGMNPSRYPSWTPATRAGLDRLAGFAPPPGAGPGEVQRAFLRVGQAMSQESKGWMGLHCDHFLSLVGQMSGRDLFATSELSDPVAWAVRRMRDRTELRRRLKERGKEFARAQQLLEAGLGNLDGEELAAALAIADPAGAARTGIDWKGQLESLVLWIGRLWERDDPAALLAEYCRERPIPGAGLWLAAAVLHLRDPQRYIPMNDPLWGMLCACDDGLDRGDASVEGYLLGCASAAALREEYLLHPFEVVELPGYLAVESDSRDEEFGGFAGDTFVFLGELARENRRAWMEEQRERYHFVVREPMLELCRALADRYIEPVLGGVHGWRLETEARPGRALTSICRNVYGRSAPYNSTLWIAYCLEDRTSAQLFVRLAPEGLRFGLRLGRGATAARERLRANVERHAATILELLRERGALESCRFGPADRPELLARLDSVAELREWAGGKSQEAAVVVESTAGDAISTELLDRILTVFDQVLPLFAACVEEDVSTELRRLGGAGGTTGYREGDFLRQTYLAPEWLSRARELLAIKQQLILQGVPGTGKTHVARCLARLLSDGQDDAVRLVQFHPSYSYEEFVEGIRVRTVESEGRQEVTYPVEDGLLCAFAARAAARPHQPHVLIVDEINRGNLPRIFGELLYLLEYRNQAVELPYSRRDFRLPANLHVIATMNAADRSLALVDQALRRRFSFLQMEPDAQVLAAWLRAHPPRGGAAFAARVVTLFERMNARLRGEGDTTRGIGHSYFMVPDLDESRLRMIWQHHVRPVLDDLYAGQAGRANGFDSLLEPTRAQSEFREAIPS